MQHLHVDEFSVADFRQTLQEGMRILRQRRWYFFFPFCIAATLAMICSLWVPRRYVTQTIIKREHDPVFTSMTGASWTQPYAQIRQRMLDDLQDQQVIMDVLDELGLPAGLERFANGELTPSSRAMRAALANEVSKGISTTPLVSTPERDVATIELSMSAAERMPELLRGIRDRYVTRAREKTVGLLRDVEQFFRAESERCRGGVQTLQRQMLEYELKQPGIDPDEPDPTRREQAELMVERVGSDRELEELKLRRDRLARKLCTADDVQAAPSEEQPAVVVRPNPRYAELTADIERLLREIAEKKTLRGMTEQHPVIRQLRATVAMRQEELTLTAEQTAVLGEAKTAGPAQDPWGRGRLAEEKGEVEAKIAVAESRLGTVRESIERIERSRALAVEQRPAYVKLKEQAANLTSELKSWQGNIGPIQHLFTVEDRDRTIHFATVQDVSPVTRPSSPDSSLVVLLCLAIGGAVGAVTVLASELLDRSYRTVRQLKTSLGLPVIEGVDEIVTATVRKSRRLRGFVLRPAAAMLCVSSMMIAGAMAYLSLESPVDYEVLRSAPVRVCEFVFRGS